jgi:hypothetical protein
VNSTYDLHSWSKQYRQEVLHEVWMTQLEERLWQNHDARSVRGSVSLALANVLSLVRGT